MCDEIADDVPEDNAVVAVAAPAPVRRAGRPIVTLGPYLLVVLIATAHGGFWHNCGQLGATDEQVAELCPVGHAVGMTL